MFMVILYCCLVDNEVLFHMEVKMKQLQNNFLLLNIELRVSHIEIQKKELFAFAFFHLLNVFFVFKQ